MTNYPVMTPQYQLVCIGQASIDTIKNGSHKAKNLMGGAAFYTAVVGASLGLRTALVSHIGSDHYSKYKSFLSQMNVDTKGVKRKHGQSTKIDLVYDHQVLLDVKVSEGVGASLSKVDVPAPYYSTTYAYVAPSPFQTQVDVAKAMKGSGVQVIFDPHADFAHLPFAFVEQVLKFSDIFFANETETLDLVQESSLDLAVDKIQVAGPSIVVVTRGSRGALVFDGTTQLEIPAIPPDRLVDVVGAGDAFKAGFIFGLSIHLPLYECGLIGAAAAACILEGYGLETVPTLRKMEHLLMQMNYQVPFAVVS